MVGVLAWRGRSDAALGQTTSVENVPPPVPAAHSAVAATTDTRGDVPGAAVIDLEVLRAEMPDNTYWTDAAPSDDEPARERRLTDKARRNALYGKVLSGTATAEEIEAYFAERERSSRDYIAFARRVLESYGEQLTPEERGLYALAIDMHGKRLHELPRAKNDAYARRAQQVAARARHEAGYSTYARP